MPFNVGGYIYNGTQADLQDYQNIITRGLVLHLDASALESYSGSGTSWFDIKDSLSNVEVLVVAGGGGGGGYIGGGGGAGGLIYNSNFPITLSTPYTVTVGAGGNPGIGAGTDSTQGGNSVFSSLTAIGGGKGAGGEGDATSHDGGSGGGQGRTPGGRGGAIGLATSGQGNNGGAGFPADGGGATSGGGGGGAGAVGGNASGGTPGNGGAGLSYDISGTATFYAGGGGGGAYAGTASSGGSGIGGAGANGQGSVAGNGATNTGSGGGSGGYPTNQNGGYGGSGIIIIRYPGPPKAIGGTISSSNGYTIHKFTSSGTFTPKLRTNFTLTNGPTFSSSNGGHIVFDGTNDYAITSASSTFYKYENELTVSWWVKLNTTLSRPGCGQSTLDVDAMGTNVWLMHGGASNQFTFYVNDSGTWRAVDSSVLTVGSWHNVTGTINTTNVSIYVNGSLSATGAGITTGILNNSNSIITFGIDPRYLTLISSYTFFNGGVATGTVYNRSLSSSEILQNYNIQKARFGL